MIRKKVAPIYWEHFVFYQFLPSEQRYGLQKTLDLGASRGHSFAPILTYNPLLESCGSPLSNGRNYVSVRSKLRELEAFERILVWMPLEAIPLL